jgi:hypothetical protein
MKIKIILMIYQSMSIPGCKLFKKLELGTKLDIYLFITDPDFDSPRLSCLIPPKYFYSKYLDLDSFD